MAQAMKQIDLNNIKALNVVRLMIHALENGCDDFDLIGTLEVIRDCLKMNDEIFNSLT